MRNSKQTQEKTLSLDFARIRCLPKRLLSAAMVADFSFGLTTTFIAMCLNVGKLFFLFFVFCFSRENKMTSQRIWLSSQKRFISSRPSRSFCRVWDATIQEVIWITGSRWSNGFAHSFRTLTITGLPLDLGNLEKNWIWKWHLENLEKPWLSRFLRPRTLNNPKYPSFPMWHCLKDWIVLLFLCRCMIG